MIPKDDEPELNFDENESSGSYMIKGGPGNQIDDMSSQGSYMVRKGDGDDNES